MEARVVCQFGVKGCSEEMSLLCRDNPPVGNRSENLCIPAHRLDDRRADEDRVIIFLRACGLFQFRNIQICFKRIDLTTERVPLNFYIHESKQGLVSAHIFREKDRARARSPNRAALTE